MSMLFTLAVFLVGNNTLAGAQLTPAENSANMQTVLAPGEFAKRVLKNSTEVQLLNIQVQAAYQTRELTRIKLTVPSLNLKLYPFGYDNRRTDTFISQYSFDDSQPGNPNPVVFSGLRQYGIDKSYYTAGSGLEFKTLTPFGGAFGFNFDYFFLINEKFNEYRQRIKFDFILSQPLFVNNVITDLRPFFNEFKILDDRYNLTLTEQQTKRNAIIKGAYKQAFGLITLQKQKNMLEETVAILTQDLKAMKIRRDGNVVSETAVQTVQVALDQRKQQLRDVTAAYNELRGTAEQTLALPPDTLVVREAGSGITNEQMERVLASDDISRNAKVRTSELEYQIARKGIFSKEIKNRPKINFNFSLQPRYPQPRQNRGDFLSSYTDFSAPGSNVDFLFTVEFVIPLLTAWERKHRRTLDILSTESNRLLYEHALDNAKQRVKAMRDEYRAAQKHFEESKIEVNLQQVFVNQKKAQVAGGTAGKLDLSKQGLQLMQAKITRWEAHKKLLLLQLNVLDEKGTNLKSALIQ